MGPPRSIATVITASRIIAGMVGGLLALALVATAGAAPSGPPVRIGMTLALTGPHAQSALIHKIAAEIYVDQLNQGNGLLGRPVELLVLDDQSRPDVTRGLYERLITVDKVDLVMGPYATDAILAAMGVAQRHRKMLIHSSLDMPHLATYEMQIPALPFGPEPNRTIPSTAFDALAATASPPATVAIVTSKAPSAQFISSGARDVAIQRGIKVVLYLEYDAGTRDFGAIAARINDASPDFLWVGSLGLDSTLLLEALRKLGDMPPRHLHLYPAPGPLATAPDGARALSITDFEEHPPFTSGHTAGRFVAQFRERARKAGLPYVRAETQAASEYAAWQVLEAAVTATKSLADKALAEWLRQNVVGTVVGRLRFDGPNNYGDDLTRIKQVQDGDWVVVWPTGVAAPGARLLSP
jgi:ABC-type branched-subunit amino acid transport system substrate-binding protein